MFYGSFIFSALIAICASITNECTLQFVEFNIHPQKTNYICKAFAFDETHLDQAFSFVPVVNNSKVVHHMVLYESSLTLKDYGTDYFRCDGMPEGSSPLWVWAIGGSAFTLPDNVKMTFGRGGVHVAVLQIHYDMSWSIDPSKEMETDSSGVILKFGGPVRELEAGMIMVGIPHERIFIPARTPIFTLSNECPSAITREIPHELVMFAVLPHMHTYGSRIESEVFHDGFSKGHIYNVEHWSFHNQRIYSSNIILEPGDSIVSRCIWNTSGSSVAVKGGESSGDEMCYAFVFYYPKLNQQLGDCFGSEEIVVEYPIVPEVAEHNSLEVWSILNIQMYILILMSFLHIILLCALCFLLCYYKKNFNIHHRYVGVETNMELMNT